MIFNVPAKEPVETPVTLKDVDGVMLPPETVNPVVLNPPPVYWPSRVVVPALYDKTLRPVAIFSPALIL